MKSSFTAVVALAWLVSVPALAASQAQDSQAIAPNQVVEGLTQSEWSRAWWQWAGSFDHAESPITDQTGELCGSKQKGPVWFLAGTYGTHRTIRTCKVPKGTYLFFPLINYVVMRPADRPVSCMAVMSSASAMTNDASALLLEVDGVRTQHLTSHRQASACFDMGELAQPKARIFPSAANGYYVMLKPLSVGKHVVHFGGALPSMLQAVSYTLIVE